MQQRSLVLGLLAVSLAALAAAPARADRLDTAITLGGTATASVATPGDVASIGFLVTAGTKRNVTFLVKRTKGSTIAPVGTLIAPDGTTFDIAANGGSVLAKPTTWSAKLPDVTRTGLWRLEVRGGTTTGGFTATIKGKDAVVLKSSKTSPPTIQTNGKNDVFIEGGDNVALTVAVARASGNKTLIPQLSIFDPSGLPLQATPVAIGNDKTGKLALKSYRLPVFGRYTLRFTGKNSTGGAFSYAITTAPAKFKGLIPTAVPGAAFEAEPGLPVTIDGSHSLPAAGQSLSYRWTQVSGPAVVLTGPTTSQPTFVAPDLGTASVVSLGFQLAVTEAGAVSKAVTVGVEVAKRPVAAAGASQIVASAAAVTLDGSGFDRRGKGLTYSWRQFPGDDVVVTLAGAGTAAPTFTAPPGNHTLHLGLVVDDGNARSTEDVVVVEVGTASASVADAGREQYVPRMASVYLCGLASTPGTGVLDSGLQWTQVSGPVVTLAGATTPWPSFTAPRATADLVFQLTAGGIAATADRVAVHVRPFETNLPVTAKANGPLSIASGGIDVSAGQTVVPAGKTSAFRWGQVAGDALPLANAGAVAATATLPAGNSAYGFAVMAWDGLQYGAPDISSVRNAGYAGLPIAIATDVPPVTQSRTVPVTVTLDGRSSARTDGGTGLTYQWTQLSGADWFDVTTSPLAWDPTASRPQFRLPVDVSSLTTTRTLLFKLVVTGDALVSQPDLVAVTIQNLPTNGKPVVTASSPAATPIVGASVSLVGTASDHENDPMTVTWTQTSGSAVTLSPSANVLTPTFVAPDSGVLVFQMTANDGFDTSTSSPVTITINRKPTASVSVTPQNGPPGTFVTMDGSQSNDPDPYVDDATHTTPAPFSFQWTQTSGTHIDGLDLTGQAISFLAPVGTVSFQLVVSDSKQNSAPFNKSFSGALPPTVTPSASPIDGTYGAAYGATVTLSANGSAAGLSYVWRWISSSGSVPAVSLSSTTAQNPTFTVPSPNSTTGPFGGAPSATFGVTASDGFQTSGEVQITVNFFASLNNGTVSQSSNNVYSIISSRCTSCHSGTANTYTGGSGNIATFYGMGTKSAFLSNSRGQNVYTTGVTKKRLPAATVTNQSGTNAYVLDRITGSATARMPSSGGYLSTADTHLIQDWIDQGVNDN